MAELPPAHLVGVGGAVGAVLRYWVGRRVELEGFPAATVVVNVVGSFVLGLVTFLGAGEGATLLVGVGACGAFTTFSSFAFETVRLYETGRRGRALVNGLGNLLASSLAVGLAWALAGLVG